MYTSKTNSRFFIFYPVIAAVLVYSVSCSTTTVTTGPTYRIVEGSSSVIPAAAGADDEENFFNTMNRNNGVDAAGNENPSVNSPPVSAVPSKDKGRARALPSEDGMDEEPEVSPVASSSARDRNADVDTSFLDDPEAQSAQGGGDITNVGLHIPAIEKDEFDEVGTASWYGRDFNGKKTASGDIFDSTKLTAAHKEMPLGSIALVRNLESGKEILVKVNDRGPYVSGRVMDLSEYAADVLGYKEKGLTTVGIKIVRKGTGNSKSEGVTAAYYGKSNIKGDSSKKADPDEYFISPRKNITESSANVVRDGSLTGYSVQVGVYGELRNAVGMQKMLSSYGDPVHILKKDNVYIVRVGDYPTRYQAEKMKYDLVADGYKGFIHEPESGNYSQY